MSFRVIIPVRYASERLPGKPLLDIAGKPMLQHVYQRAIESGAVQVVIATDDDRIRETAEAFGADVCMTSADHKSGTDRLAEVVVNMEYPDDSIVVNLQGDEPLMPPALIGQVADNLITHHQAEVATLCEPIDITAEIFDPNVVKVVTDHQGFALYFSRAPIAWDRAAFSDPATITSASSSHYRHVGLYAYRAAFLRRYVNWSQCELEKTESLEQLRVLWNGYKIHVDIAAESPGHGVDTEADLDKARQLIADR